MIVALDFIRLTRPYMVVCALIAFVAGAAVSGAEFGLSQLSFGLATVLTAVAGWFVLNDVFDRERDKLNKPGRAIASGRVGVKSGALFASVLFVISLLTLLQLPSGVQIWFIGIAPILLLYSQLKVAAAWAANVATATVGATMALAGAAMTGQFGYSWLIASFAFLLILGREIVKDIEDIRGDKAVGLKTMPIVFGKRASLWAVTFLWGLVVIAIPIPYAIGIFSLGYLLLALTAGLLLSISLSNLNGDINQESISRSLRLSRYGLALGVVAFTFAV